MSILDFVFPARPRRGWPGYWTYIIRETAQIVVGAALLLGIVYGLSAVIFAVGPR